MSADVTDKKPAYYWLAVALTALMTYRLLPLVSYADLGGSVPISWVNPFTGDILVGATAPIMTYLLIRYRTLAVWTFVVVWHALGIWDYMTGVILDVVDPIPWAPPGSRTLLVTGVIVQVINMVILTQRAFHDYYAVPADRTV